MATSRPVASDAASAGRRSTASSTRDQARPRAPERLRRPMSGTRPRLIRSPSDESRAGRTVTEPSIETPTTMIVPVANDEKVGSPVKYMPAIATITVRPETSTERPEVSAAISSASRASCPRSRSSRSRRM